MLQKDPQNRLANVAGRSKNKAHSVAKGKQAFTPVSHTCTFAIDQLNTA
jgi:hypothetical protein